ncbi:MAG: serine/threonine protein kinase [Myxococcales bacterium]|nr:serine/threonine protein kinase [Myxococcales bacterium]
MSRGSPSEEFGPYLVYEQLGAGGMAEVHRAEQAGIEGFRKVVALKRMLPHVAANDDMVKSFVREARLASYLRHANVAQTYDLGKVGDTYFIAMELIEGRSLRDVLRRCASLNKVMPVAYSLNILNQICDALDYAHNLCDEQGNRLGIIHRDVSPSNVLVAEDGVVKLIDFGIAKASASGMQTMSGTIKGKYGYMAPEYLGGTIDARADLFAIGVIAHELLTNRPLFTTPDDIDTLQRVRSMQIQPPSRKNPAVPAEIDDIVMTALERDPDARWQHATALRTALTTLTKRLGMQVTNQEVVVWLDALDFDSATLPFDGGRPSADAGGGDSVIISIEHGGRETPLTLQVRGPAAVAPAVAPLGTPAQPMTAQRSIQPSLPPKELQTSAEYDEAVRRYERHDALIPSASFLADEIVPTQVRPSSGKLAPVPLDADPVRASLPTMVGVSAAAVATEIARVSAARAAVAPPTVAANPPPHAVAANQPPHAVAANPPAHGTTRLTAVLLVLLAAAVAATAVYFLLPLFT